MSRVIVVGGGAAGCFAAIAAAEGGHRVILIEHNEKIGKKIYITGKGRCNLTNAADMEEIFANVMSNRKFLYSAFDACDNQRVMDFFETHGMPIKIERGNRVFPVSDHSSDVIRTLTNTMKQKGVEIRLQTHVEGLLVEENVCRGVSLATGEQIKADAVILATGGLSYPSTGSTGDGHRMAEETGHKITKLTPSLVPFETKESYGKELQGLSLKNVTVTIRDGKKKLYEDFGEMLFTHFGVSGPLILSASGSIRPDRFEKELAMTIDLKPALDRDQLDKRLLRDFEAALNKQYKNALEHLLPGKLLPVFVELSGIDPDKKVNEISKGERSHILDLLKAFPLTITGLRGFHEAIITKGGVSVKDVNPSTMESKRVRGLYLCGELLDLDALTGGYNLQIAWSTGYLAGKSICNGLQ